MAYINFTKQSIVVLNGFEAAAYVESCTTNDGEPWCESEFDLLMEHGLTYGIIFPLSNDQFRDWFVEFPGQILKYKVADIAAEKRPLYYVIRNERTVKQLKFLFDERFVAYRTYNLYATFYN